MNQRCHALLSVLLLLGMAAAQAQEARTPRQLIEHLGVQIRQNLEDAKPAQTPEELERAVAAQITAFMGGAPGHPALTATDASGLTPLMLAAGDGYPHIVSALLADASVKLRINEPDSSGATAWMLANFALPLTLVACEPGTLTLERHPLLPPYQRRMAHLLKDKGAAIGAIPKMLEGAGASADAEAAKRVWLGRCPNAAPELREALASNDLRPTLVKDALARLRAFNKLAQEAPKSIPMRPPRDMVFVRVDAREPSDGRGSPLRQFSQMTCVGVSKPEVPWHTLWYGRVALRVVARTRAGVVETADITVLDERYSPEVTDQLSIAILRALATYQCEGDAIFEQVFHFQFH